MALTATEVSKARKILEHAARPLFLHDDDCDGVSSFVMATQFAGDGKGVCVNKSPNVSEEYLRKVQEYQPDVIVILDKPQVDETFLSGTNVPILWIDHHEPQDVTKYKHVTYLNPRTHNNEDNRPTSYWTYTITKKNLWIATMGCVADWHIPDFIKEFDKTFPGLLPTTYETVEEIYLHSSLGKVIKAIQFNLKGTVADVRKSILTLTRIEHPREILEQTTPRGRFIWNKYRKLAAGYERHLKHAIENAKTPGHILLYEYDDEQTYTAELSNELLIRYPQKITIISRKHDGKRKCSIRSSNVELPTRIEQALKGLDGRGGGHTNACGVVVREEDWQTFYDRMEQSL